MRRWVALVMVFGLVVGWSSAALADPRPRDPAVVPGSYIVVLNDGDPGSVAAEHRRDHDVTVRHVYRHAVRGYSARMSAQAAARIARLDRVAYVDEDRVVSTAHHQCGHAGGRGAPACGTLAGKAADATGTGIAGVTVAVGGAGSTTTGADGRYSVTVPVGAYTVTASKDGYASSTAEGVAVTSGATATLDFTLISEAEPPEPPPPLEDAPPADHRVPTGLQRSHWSDATAFGRSHPGVAIIDTGVASHPDLNVAGGVNCSTGRTYSDGNGHGTHVAGTVGAAGEIVGVAPGAPLYAVRVLNNSGSGTWSDVICGVDWVTANAVSLGIKVANMSLGGGGSAGTSCASSSLRQAICNSVARGVTYVVAAGNAKADAATSVPAAYPEVVTVAALADFDGLPGGAAPPTCRSDVDDTVASFSNHGAAVDVIAPGVCIESTWHTGGYATISGTSMAAPHVAGAAAHHLAQHASKSPAEVRAALTGTGSTAYSFTWDGSAAVPGSPWPLLDLRGL